MLWLLYALISALFVALTAIFDKIGLRNTDALLAAFINSAIATLFLFITTIVLKKFNSHTFQAITSTSMMFIVFGGIAMGLSWFFYLMALKDGLMSQVTAVYYINIVLIMILGLLIFGESFGIKEISGSALILMGAYLMIK